MTTDDRLDAVAQTVGAVKLDVDALKQTVNRIAASQQEIQAAFSVAQAETISAVVAAEQRAAERARDMQTEILRAIEASARGVSARVHRLETSDADVNARIAALEERVLYLWTGERPQ
jgi:phage shock protein A